MSANINSTMAQPSLQSTSLEPSYLESLPTELTQKIIEDTLFIAHETDLVNNKKKECHVQNWMYMVAFDARTLGSQTCQLSRVSKPFRDETNFMARKMGMLSQVAAAEYLESKWKWAVGEIAEPPFKYFFMDDGSIVVYRYTWDSLEEKMDLMECVQGMSEGLANNDFEFHGLEYGVWQFVVRTQFFSMCNIYEFDFPEKYLSKVELQMLEEMLEGGCLGGVLLYIHALGRKPFRVAESSDFSCEG